MSIESKKMAMADRMYNQNSKAGKGTSPKNYQNGKETKTNSKGQKFEMNGKDTGYAKGEKYSQADKKGSFGSAKYNQSDPSGSITWRYKMHEEHKKLDKVQEGEEKKKGKGSLNPPKAEKNEGEKHYLGKDEEPVS